MLASLADRAGRILLELLGESEVTEFLLSVVFARRRADGELLCEADEDILLWGEPVVFLRFLLPEEKVIAIDSV